ncbi:MAG: hypothetical protein QG628_854 [Patescibacteria group bacterium]|jgi:hypothetical protein|nr:hypothetical protein [Patescibacteria group bacterium]
MKKLISSINSDPSLNKGNTTRAIIATAMLAASLALGACSGNGEAEPFKEQKQTTTTIDDVVRRSDVEPPTQPVGGQYDTASDAVFAMYNTSDIVKTDTLMGAITDPTVRAEAEKALDVAEAAQATWAASHKNDFEEAEMFQSRIADPKLRVIVDHDIDVAEAERAVWSAYNDDDFVTASDFLTRIETPGILADAREAIDMAKGDDHESDALSAWSELYRQERSEWGEHYNNAGSEWGELYHHTTAYADSYYSLPE